MAFISVTYTFSNGTAADATQVNTNFSDVIAGTSDGTKDFYINALTAAGVATFNGNVLLGNASGDDIQFNGSLATSIPIKTTTTYNIGSADLGLQSIYFGMNSTHTIRLMAAASGASADYTLTLPPTTGTIYDVPYSSDAASTLLWRKDSAISVNSAAGTSGVTLTNASTSISVFTNSAAITVKLDNSFLAGRQMTIVNNGTAEITLTANDNSTIATVYRKTAYTCLTPSATPTTNTSWLGLTPIISPEIEVGSLFTPNGFGTVSNKVIYAKRIGADWFLRGEWTNGTVTASEAKVQMSGFTIDSNFVPSTPNRTGQLGIWSTLGSAALSSTDAHGPCYAETGDLTYIQFCRSATSNAFASSNASTISASSNNFTFEARLPISGWSVNKG